MPHVQCALKYIASCHARKITECKFLTTASPEIRTIVVQRKNNRAERLLVHFHVVLY